MFRVRVKCGKSERVIASIFVALFVVLFGPPAGAEDIFQRYCKRVSGIDDGWGAGVWRSRQETMTQRLTYSVCETLREENLLPAPCEAKRALFVELFRHADEKERIKRSGLGLSLEANREYQDNKEAIRAWHLETACQLTGP
jgi:hypothetical protein